MPKLDTFTTATGEIDLAAYDAALYAAELADWQGWAERSLGLA